MKEILNLYGSLILTFLGFVMPVLAILLSVFSEGAKLLRLRYKNDQEQDKQNLIRETRKIEKGENLNTRELKKRINLLEEKIKRTEIRISFLEPINFITQTAFPFLLSLIALFFFLGDISYSINIFTLLVSVGFFGVGLYALSLSLSVIVEVVEVVDNSKKETQESIIKLLTAIAENSGIDNLFIQASDIKVNFNKAQLSSSSNFDFCVNKEYEIPISVINNSDLMAKNIQTGFRIGQDVLIQNAESLRSVPDQKLQIIRFNSEKIPSEEERLYNGLKLTFLTKGEHSIGVFVKGENIRTLRFKFKVNVVE